MATSYSQLNLNIKTTSDLAGVNQLKQQLNEIRTLASNVDFTGTLNPTQIDQMVIAARHLDSALDAAFDVNLNTINIQKFNQYLKDSGTSLSSIQAGLANAGTLGQQAFINTTNQLLRFNTVVKQTNSFLNTMKTSFTNTLRWTIMSGAIQGASRSIQEAYSYVKELDTALNDIRIVTGKSTEQMAEFAVAANDAAKALAVSTTDYTEGALIYYQQGLDDETVKTLTEVTAMTSNVTQQSMETVSEQLTAVWNGYQVANEAAREGMGVYKEYVDKMAAVGAATASNLEELATAMSKVASAASSMGIGFDELNAQIATIVSVTRQAPESVGTALKTIYARLGDLQVDGVDEFGTKLGEVSGKLQTMGIDILDANGTMKDMDVVMTEVAEKWDTWTEAQRQAAAVAMAGKRQYNNLIALFDNWEMYADTLDVATNAAGTLDEQQSIALDSLDNKLDILSATAEDFYNNLFDEKSLKSLTDGLIDIVQTLANVTESIGGLKSILPLLGSLLLKTFGNNIADSLLMFKNNLNATKNSVIDTEMALKEIQTLYPKFDFVTSSGDNASAMNAGVRDMVNYYKEMLPLKQQMSQQDMQIYNSILDQKAEAANLNIQLEQQVENYKNISNAKMFSGVRPSSSNETGFAGFKELAQSVGAYDQAFQNFDSKISDFSNKLNGVSEQNLPKAKLALEEFYKELKQSKQLDNGAIDKLNQEIDEFIGKKRKLTPEEFEKIRKVLENYPKAAKNILQVEDALKRLKNSSNNAGKSLKENLQFKQVAQNVMKAISAFGQLSSAISSLSGIGSILTNDDISGWQKFLQITTSVGFALPMLINSFKTLGVSAVGAVKSLNTSLMNLGAQTAITTLATEANIKVTKDMTFEETRAALIEARRLQLQREEAARSGIKVQQLKKEQKEQIKLTAIEQIDAELDKKKIFQNGIQIGLEQILSKVRETLTKKTTILLGIEMTRLAALGWIALALAAVVAVVALVVAAYQSYQKSLEQAAEKAEAEAQSQKKMTEAMQEQKEAIDNLIDGYDNLQKQYENNELSLKELRSKTYDLCLQYEQEDLALQILMADYEQLNQLMKEAQVYANTRVIEESATEKDSLVNATSTKFMAEAKGTMRDYGYNNIFGNEATLDIKTGLGSNEEKEIISYLEEKFGIVADNGGHIKTEEFSKAVVENYDEIYNKFSSIGGKTAQELLENMDNISENAERYQEILSNQITAYKDNLIIQYASGIKTLTEYTEAYEKIVNEAMGNDLFETREEAMNWAHTQLMSNLEDDSIAISGKLATLIQENTEKEFDVINEEIQKFTEQEQYFLYLHLKLDEDSIKNNYNKLEGIVEKYSNYIEGLAYKEGADVVGSLLTVEEKTELTQDEIDSLFDQKNFEQIINVSQEDFEKMDWVTQRALMQQYYTSATEELLKYNDTAALEGQELVNQLKDSDIVKITDATEKVGMSVEEFEDEFHAIKGYNIITDEFGNKIAQSYDTSNLSEQMKRVISEIAGKSFEDLSEEEINEIIKEWRQQEKELLKNGKTFSGVANAYSDAILEAESNTSALTNAERDLDKTIAINKGNLTAFSGKLSDIKSTYESLNSVVEDYNDNGSLSIDSIQTLLSLSDEQLMYLNYENGQMSINNDLMKQALIAKIQNAKATLFQATQDGLKAIAEGKTYEISTALIGTTDTLTEASWKEADAVATDGQAWYNLAIAKAAVEGTAPELVDDMEAFAETMRKQYLTLTDFEKQATSTDLSKIFEDSKVDKEIDDERDRYWDLNNTLEDTTKAVEALDEAQQHLHGDALIDSLTEENDLLQKQKEAYEAIREEQSLEAQELRNQLKNYGFSFENGLITNYKDATSQLVNALNSDAIDEDTYEKVKENLERYDELVYDEMVETAKNIQDTAFKQAENNLEGWEAKVEMELDTSQAERDFNDFMKEIGEDFTKTLKLEDLGDTLKNIDTNFNTYYNSDESGSVGTLQKDLAAIEEVEAEIQKMHEQGENYDFSTGMFTSIGDAQEKLKELRDTLMDDAEAAKDLWQEAWDTYMEGIDHSAEDFEKLGDELSRINEGLEYQRELVELIYGPEAYGMQRQIFDAQINNSLTQIDSARQQVDLWQKYYSQAEDGTEEQLKYAELLQEAQAELNDLTLEHIQLLKDEYANTMNDIISKLEKDITGGLGLDNMKEEWEEALEESEKYYDNIERIFELETLENKFQKAIDNTSDPKYQQAIKDLMDDQLSTLKDKEELTEYDVQLAEKRLGILQAEAALEDAQNAKNAMKLVRGASGNWEYQYVADTSDVEAKQQALRDSYQELYEFTKDAQIESIEALMNAKENYINKLNEIQESDVLSEEEKQEKIAELNDKYWNSEYGIITKLQNDYNSKSQDLSRASAETLLGLYDADEAAYYDMTDTEKRMVDDLKTYTNGTYTDMYKAIKDEYDKDKINFDAYVYGNLDTWQTTANQMAAAWNGNEDSIRTNVDAAYDAMIQASDDYEVELEKLQQTSGDVFSKEGIAGDIAEATTETERLKSKTEELVNTANNVLPQYKTLVDNIGTSWGNVSPKIQEAIDKIKEYLKIKEIDVNSSSDGVGDGSGTVAGDNSGYKGNSIDDDGTSKIEVPVSTTVETHGGRAATLPGQDIQLYNSPGGMTKYKATGDFSWTYYPHYEKGGYHPYFVTFEDGKSGYMSKYDYNKYTAKRYQEFASGGYTGDWSGGEGRIAVLHSKELVLNKADTENILNAISAVRDIAGITGSVGSAIMQNIKSMIAEVLGISAGTGYTTGSTNNETSNVFNITAEFPNANDVTSIREAILSLPNLASQYVAENRK